MKYSSEVPDSTPAVLGTRSSSQSYRKLLASHLSIYNALNDPELNQGVYNDPEQESHGSKSLQVSPVPEYEIHFPEAKLPSRVPTPELQFSWQLLSNESVYRDARVLKKPSSSILSSTTDDKDESMVLVSRNGGSPSFGGVMVFETDEEDPLDGEPEFLPNQKSFVMPKMLLSEQQVLDIVILSNSHGAECDALVDRIKHDLVSTKMSIANLPVSSVGDSADLSLALRQADLVFMINDGSPLFIKCLETVFDQPDSVAVPKLTVINMMSVNYFINLFDLIAFMRPFQIWKTSSLHQQNLVARIEDYILLESLTDSLECQGTGGIDSIMDLSVARTCAPNYKQIERQIRHELQDSVSLSSSDPLRLSSSFYHVDILYTIIKKMFRTNHDPSNPHDSGDSKLWLFCSFALGIGLGITLAGSAATVFGFCVSNAITHVEEKPEIKGLLARPVRVVDVVDEWVQGMVDSQFCCTITRWWDNFSGSMQLFSSHMGPLPRGAYEVNRYQFGGRLIPRTVVENNTAELVKVYQELTAGGVLLAGSTANYKKPAGAPENGVLPAWRNTMIQQQLITNWNSTAPWATMEADQQKMTNVFMPKLEAITPGSGAYMNEADFQQPNWQSTFFGDNYAKLAAIKKKYDPKDVFYILKGVGSEAWNVAKDGRMCRA